MDIKYPRKCRLQMFIVHHVITVNKWNEVCVPPPRIIQRCPNRGDVGSRSCAQERCKELNGYVKCPNFPYCMDKWYIDKYCPKDNDLKKFMKIIILFLDIGLQHYNIIFQAD